MSVLRQIQLSFVLMLAATLSGAGFFSQCAIDEIEFTKKELEGLTIIDGLSPWMISATQKVFILLTDPKGNALDQENNSIDAILTRLNSIKANSTLSKNQAGSSWSEIKYLKEQHQDIRDRSPDTPPDVESILVDTLAQLNSLGQAIKKVAEDSNLVLDVELDSYYLMDLVVTQAPNILRHITDDLNLSNSTLLDFSTVNKTSIKLRDTDLSTAISELQFSAFNMRKSIYNYDATSKKLLRDSVTLEKLVHDVIVTNEQAANQQNKARLAIDSRQELTSGIALIWASSSQILRQLLNNRLDLLYSNFALRLGLIFLLFIAGSYFLVRNHRCFAEKNL